MKKLTPLLALIFLCSQVPTICMDRDTNNHHSNHNQNKRKRDDRDDENNKQHKHSKKDSDEIYEMYITDEKYNRSKLHVAILRKDIERVQEIIKNEPQFIYELDANGEQPLSTIFSSNIKHETAVAMFEIFCRYFKENNLESSLKTLININTNDGHTPLSTAIMDGNHKAVALLLNHGADPKKRYFDKKSKDTNLTVLHIAATKTPEKNRSLVLTELLKNEDGLNLINKQLSDGSTALHISIANGDIDSVKVLLKNGADTTIKKSDNGSENHVLTVLHQTLLTKNSENAVLIIEELLKNDECKKLINEKLNNGSTILSQAVLRGNREVVKILISNGADTTITYPNKENNSTILHLALLNQNSNLHKILKELFKDKKCRQLINEPWYQKGDTALSIAVAQGNYKAVKVLLKNGADTTIDYKDIKKQDDTLTILHRALLAKNFENADLVLIELLKDDNCKRKIDQVAFDNKTSLDIAIEANDKDCVKILLENGANPTLVSERSIHGRSFTGNSLDLAREKKNTHHGIIDLLEKYCSKYRSKHSSSSTTKKTISKDNTQNNIVLTSQDISNVDEEGDQKYEIQEKSKILSKEELRILTIQHEKIAQIIKKYKNNENQLLDENPQGQWIIIKDLNEKIDFDEIQRGYCSICKKDFCTKHKQNLN